MWRICDANAWQYISENCLSSFVSHLLTNTQLNFSIAIEKVLNSIECVSRTYKITVRNINASKKTTAIKSVFPGNSKIENCQRTNWKRFSNIRCSSDYWFFSFFFHLKFRLKKFFFFLSNEKAFSIFIVCIADVLFFGLFRCSYFVLILRWKPI